MSRGRSVALLCIDPWLKEDGDYRPFNYPVRRVLAALHASGAVRPEDLHLIEATPNDVADFVARVEAVDPDVVGASAYVWSFPIFIEVARQLKARRPDRKIVFGGPSARPEMFALAPYRDAHAWIDALVPGEGEEVMLDIVALADRPAEALRDVAGLFLPDASGAWIETATRPGPALDTLASPHALGLAPRGVTGHLETFRGCPFTCTFCQWGDGKTTSRVFSKDTLVKELEAFAALDVRGVTLVDAGLNLNSRAFRNLREAEREVRFLRDRHFQTELYPTATHEHLEFLDEVHASSVGIGLQSYDKGVLEGVERRFDVERFERLVTDVASIVPDTVIEIIMGLPGDNPESFARTVERVRGLPACVRVFRCLVLPSALMTRAPADFDMQYDPVTLEMISCRGWSRDDIERTCAWLDELVEGERGEALDGSGTWKLPSFSEGAKRREDAAKSRGGAAAVKRLDVVGD